MKQAPKHVGEEALLFTEKNISSIAGQQQLREELRQHRLQAVAETLSARKEDLDRIMKTTGFTAANLSSIFTAAGAHLNDYITLLYDYRHPIANVTKSGVLLPDNLSAVLHRGGSQLEARLAAITSPANISRMEALTEEVMTQDNLAYMLGSASKYDVTTTLTAAANQLQKLHAISTRFKPSEMATHLRDVAPETMAVTIHGLYEALKPFTEYPGTEVTSVWHHRRLSLKGALEMQRGSGYSTP